MSCAHIYNSNLNTLKLCAHTGAIMPQSQAYLRLFFILKGQRSMIDTVIAMIEQTIESEPSIRDNTTEMDQFNSLINLVIKLQNATLGTLYPISNEVVQEIHTNFLIKPLSPNVYKYVLKVLKACLAITSYLSMILVDIECSSKKSDRSKNDSVNKSILETKDEDDYIVCRICDQKVKSDLFEEHTELCIDAYKNEAKLLSINSDLLEIQKIIINDILNGPWPGVRDTSINVGLPTLHASILLNRAFEIDPRIYDSSDELQSILISLDFFTHLTLPNEVNIQIVQLRAKVNEKRMASNAIREAEDILAKTRVNANEKHSFSHQTTIADFQLIKPISSGAFARVFLAKKKQTGDVYAIKVQPKDDVIQKNQVKRVMAEKDILLQFNNPYIINFYYSFVGQHNLYLVMEYLPGGDLYSLLQNVSALDEESTRIYTIQIAKAIGYLHSRNIIHRDIKPDNILIAKDGKIRLTDFGLSYIGCVNRQVGDGNSEPKPSLIAARSLTLTVGSQNVKSPNPLANFSRNRTNTISNSKSSMSTTELMPQGENLVESRSLVGTPDYIAPEIILNLPHTFTVDWWSLGVMVYEFLMGIPPFHGESVEETRDLIMKGRYKRPTLEDDDVSEECADFIDCLLQQDPKKRLGAKGLDEVLNHKWLKDFNIEETENPFVPELKSELDTTYFEERSSSTIIDDDIFADIRHAEDEQEKIENQEKEMRIQMEKENEEINNNNEQVNVMNQNSETNIQLSGQIYHHQSSESSLSSEDIAYSNENVANATKVSQQNSLDMNLLSMPNRISNSNSNFDNHINKKPLPASSFRFPNKKTEQNANGNRNFKQIGSLGSFGSFSSYGSFSGNSNESSPRQSSSFLLSSECGDDIAGSPDNEMSSFPSVSVDQLGNANRQLSLSRRKNRPRATSFFVEETASGSPVGSSKSQENGSDSPIASKAFIGLNPAGTRRRGRRQSFMPNFSSFDDFKKITMKPKVIPKTSDKGTSDEKEIDDRL